MAIIEGKANECCVYEFKTFELCAICAALLQKIDLIP